MSTNKPFKPLHPARLQFPLERELRYLWESLSTKQQNAILVGPSCSFEELPSGTTYEFDAQAGVYRPFPYGEMTDRDRMVAAEVLQWLGTPVGFSRLAHALRKAGYEVEKAVRGKERGE